MILKPIAKYIYTKNIILKSIKKIDYILLKTKPKLSTISYIILYDHVYINKYCIKSYNSKVSQVW